MNQKWLKIVGLILIVASLTSNTFALDFNLAPLEYNNRAACAALSNKPARSAFMLVDAFNAGKATYAESLKKNENHNAKAEEGVKLFRLMSTHLAVEIANKIMDGTLPLLPVNDEGSWKKYFEASKGCLEQNRLLTCPKMNDFLSDVWSRSHLSKKDADWGSLGATENDFWPKQLKAKLGCRIVKKFSSFHSNINNAKPTRDVLQQIGIESQEPETFMDSCFAYDKEDKDTRFSTIQLDIADSSSDADWDNIGFRFWHTLKLYLSWGFRYAPEYQKEFGEYKRSFSSLAFEDSIMFMPNGCRSITIPQCNDMGLASDAMRAAKYLGMTHVAVSELPIKPIDVLFQGQAQSINNDEMGLFKAENADLWYKDFKDKLSNLRVNMVSRLNIGLTKLNIITYLLNVETLSKDLEELTKVDPETLDKNEIFLACMETSLIKNQFYDDIYQEIQKISETKELDQVLQVDMIEALPKYVDYFSKLTTTMGKLCKNFEERNLLRNATPKIYNSLNNWAFGVIRPAEKYNYTNQCLTNPKNVACPNNIDKKYITLEGKGVVVCKTALECSRIVLESMVNVVSVRRYAKAFLPLNETIQSPSLLNTYAMPLACKLYDPFALKNRAWKLFVADLASSVLYGATCGAFSFNLIEPKSEQVASLEAIQKDYITTYEAKMRKLPASYALDVNLGFLTGIPCSFGINNQPGMSQANYTPNNYYNGINLRYCKGKSEVISHVDNTAGNASIGDIKNNTYNACFQCGINVRTIAASSAQAMSCFTPQAWVGKAIIAGASIFQSSLRFFSNLHDENNIARTYEINVDQISKSMENAGVISKKCHHKLKKGFTCK